MNDRTLDPTHQLVIVARLGEYCRFRGHTLYHERDPWFYMREKLMQIEEPLSSMKEGLFAATRRKLLEEMREGGMSEERFSEYKGLFERLLSRGDFADLAFHLTTAAGPSAIRRAEEILLTLNPVHLFIEERLPAEQRSPSWEKLVKELYIRLDLDLLGRVLQRKPRTAKRKAVILRRVRSKVAEYCTVVRIPMDAADTFTPFMLPRIEALVAANLRFLNKYR
jgi:hypothetical protein